MIYLDGCILVNLIRIKRNFESSNILKDANYQYRIKEIHTQNVFGKFVPEDAGEGCEDTVIFSDEYFDKQWKKQAADDEEVSMLEVFSFPKTKRADGMEGDKRSRR